MKLSQYRVETPPIQDDHTQTVNRVIWSSLSQQAMVLDEETWQRVREGDFEALPDSILTSLVKAELLVPDDEDELTTLLRRNAAASADYKTAYLVVQPTAACQFGCVYCGQTHRNQFLSEQHQAKVVERAYVLLASGRYRELEVGWFGAEATLAMSQIRTLTKGFQAIAQKHGCRYHARLVTNGYLLNPELATELVNELGVDLIEITLDGTSEHHNRSRPTKGGGSTFDRVFANTLHLARREDLPVQLNVRCNVTRDNREGVLELLERFAREGVQRRLHIYAAPIHDWGNQARAEHGSPQEDFAAWETVFFIRALQLGFPMKLLPGRRAITCMVFKPGAEMVDAYGHRFNCTEVSYVDAYEETASLNNGRFGLPLVPVAASRNRYAIGHLDQEGDIAGRREMLSDFPERVARGDYPCVSCPMLPVCGGHCPKSWLEGQPACPSAKFNIIDRLVSYYAQERGAFNGIDKDKTATPS